MEIDIQPVDGISVATIVGDIDGSNAAAAQSRILSLAQNSGKFVLDMSKVGYMSSAGLRMLLAMTIVPALQLVAWRIDQSANVAAVLGVVLALWLGTVLADRVCVFLVIPKVQGK